MCVAKRQEIRLDYWKLIHSLFSSLSFRHVFRLVLCSYVSSHRLEYEAKLVHTYIFYLKTNRMKHNIMQYTEMCTSFITLLCR